MMTVTRFTFSPNCFVITVDCDWMNCMFCQTEDGPRADGPRGCGHEGTPQEHRAGCCHAGRCLHRWDQVGRSRLTDTTVKWISNWIHLCPLLSELLLTDVSVCREGVFWTPRMSSVTCRQSRCPVRYVTGWPVPSAGRWVWRGVVLRRSQDFGALSMQCKLVYL